MFQKFREGESLKITEWSKNYYLKIPVCVRMYARVYARVYDCQDTIRTHDQRKRGTQAKREICLYIGLIADNEKKVQKKSNILIK